MSIPLAGEQQVTIGIEPIGKFNQPVELGFDTPTGVTVSPEEVVVPAGSREVSVTVSADRTAHAGKSLIRVRAAPQQGEPQFEEIDIEIVKQDD